MLSLLEPAEFYYLHDVRDDSELLCGRDQVEADPLATTRVAREIARRHMALDPTWTAYDSLPTYFDRADVEIGPDLVLNATAFAAPRPGALPHHDLVGNPSEGHAVTWYEIVSAEWRAAIESFEPGVHRFFPHELRFADGVFADRFVFRCRTHLENVAPRRRVENVLDVWSDIVGYRFVVDYTYAVPTLDRERVEGRHFVRGPDRQLSFVSRALAEKLLPLLPEKTALLPVKLSDAEPRSVPVVSPAMADAGLKGAVKSAASKHNSAEQSRPLPAAPPSGTLDPKLANAIAVLNVPNVSDDAPRKKAQSLLEGKLAKASVAQLFDVMAEALKSSIPLQQNIAFNLAFLACYERRESDLLSFCRAWAADPSPLKRVAVARALSRPIPEDESPNPEIIALMTGLLDDRDPNVVSEAIGIIAWMSHPAYNQLLKSRRDRFAYHESPKVRETARVQIDIEEEQAAVPEFPGEELASLFGAVFEARRENRDFRPRLEALRHRDAAEVAVVAARWSEDANPDRRELAALAMERPSPIEAPKAAIDVLRKLSGDSDATVAEAAVKALQVVRGPGPVSRDDLAILEAGGAHPSAAARAAYVESLAFGETPEALDALLALADDPDEEVRTKVALYLDNYIDDSKGKRRERLRETLAVMVSDTSNNVRWNAIDALTRLNDPRAVDAIVHELEAPEEELSYLCDSVLGAILERPNNRYLPGLERMNKEIPDDDDIEEAIRSCRARRRSSRT